MSSAEQTPLSGTERTSAGGAQKAVGGTEKAVGRTERTPPPTRLAAAAAVAAVEALGLVAGGVYMLVKALTGSPGDLTGALTGAVTLVVLGLIPLAAARGLWLRRSWSRGPAVITQILALPVAWQMLQANSALIPAGAVLGVLAVTGLVLLVSPATTEALGIRRPGQDTP